LNANLLQGLFDLIEFERLDDRFDLFHVVVSFGGFAPGWIICGLGRPWDGVDIGQVWVRFAILSTYFGQRAYKVSENESLGDLEMTDLLTAARMRAIEHAAIASGAVTGVQLMERAGAGVVDAVFAHWPDLARAPAPDLAPAASAERGASPSRSPEFSLQDEAGPWRAVVLCGPGNNGGDGFVVARLLQQAGWAVEVFLFGDPGKLPPDARTNYDRWCGLGPVGAVADLAAVASDLSLDLFVDAGFGTGLTRALPDAFAEIACALGRRAGPGRIVAVDIPSGLCADSGRTLGSDPSRVFLCDLTVTFHRPKLGHYLAQGPDCAGALVTIDIGL
jgi:hydroxyethylthiazole kinase-like uncharacterized protein yjeF